ncbi:MAG: hypothetical protein H7343_18315 [Undibacterium sp.]|nr:hypothetical protein [Opitutaceae bacterium]
MNRFFLAATLFGAPGLFAAGGGQATAYEQAVASYIDGATEQMRAIRAEVDVATAKAGDAGKRAYAEVYRGLDQCDAMVAQLRVSGPKDFDLIKARFETTRTRMVAALGNVRKSPPPDQPSATD